MPGRGFRSWSLSPYSSPLGTRGIRLLPRTQLAARRALRRMPILSMALRHSRARPDPMVCEDCWRPLERAVPEALTAERKITVCWGRVIELETEVATALSGKTPDQFRFNFTSANQLLNEVRDICELLAGSHRCFARTDMPLNGFACPAMTPGRMPVQFLPNETPFPLAIADMPLRRCLLATATALIDPRPETGCALLGPDAPGPSRRCWLAWMKTRSVAA